MKKFALLCLSIIAVPSFAQSSITGVSLAPIHQLRSGVDAWPLVLNPVTPTEQRINRSLAQLNDDLANAIQGCDAGFKDSAREDGDTYRETQWASDWSRTVKITMNGPDFLSFTADDSDDCGGVHPGEGFMAVVYDLHTGARINWLRYIAPSARASSYSGMNEDGTPAGAIVLPALTRFYIAHASSDCIAALSNPQPFLLWPDAKSGTLVASTFGLPTYGDIACPDLKLTPAEAHQLGFSDALFRPIIEAHQQISASH